MSNCPGGVPARAQESFQEVTRMKKRLLSILFTLAVCVGLLSVTALATDDGHTHSYTNGFCTENGCGAYQPAELKDGVYQIANAGQLYWFAGLVNGTVDGSKHINANAVLTANITVNTGVLNADGTVNMGEQNGDGTSTLTFRTWTPIVEMTYKNPGDGDPTNTEDAYAGSFNGQNYTISGLYINDENKNDCALFGRTAEGARISNLTVSGSYFHGYKRADGVCGWNTGTIENCTNTSTVFGDSRYIGGVCGYNASTGKLINCTNTGTVTGKANYTGGVCGDNAGTISNCTNTGTVSGTTYTGGVCGNNNRQGTGASIVNCTNTGAVTGSGNYTGGVCGYNNSTTSSKGTITNCTNSGNAHGAGDYTGGVCGYNADTMTNCTNSGTVSGTNRYTGGVCGFNASTGKIENCRNEGDVIGTTYTGGVSGYNNSKDGNTGTITGCTNSGTVNGTSNTGGVCGENYYGTITDCTNSGAVTGTSYSTGGVCGKNEGAITNCTNSGTVSGTTYTGGVCGYNGGTITNCTNTNSGTVTGTGNYTGGVCGINGGTGTIENCRNEGNVTGTKNTGGVCGYNAWNSTAIPDPEFGTITNCANSGAVTGTEDSIGGVCGVCNGIVTNCANSGTVSGKSDTGGVCGRNNSGTITNCYFNSNTYLGNAVGSTGSDGTTTDDVEGKTAAQFASGEVAWLLNGSTNEGTPAWRQNLDNGNTPDAYPLPVGTEEDSTGIVYKVPKFDPCNSETGVEGYSNYNKSKLIHSLTDVTEVPATYESDGVKAHRHCTVCGKDFIDGVEQSTDDLKLPKLVMPIIPVIPTYPPVVSQPAEGGTVAVSPQAPAQGVTVTITPRPEDGYEVGGVSVTDRIGNPVAVKDNGNGTYSFTQPAGAVTVNVTFADKTQLAFTDVSADAYYYDAVQWAVKNGITYGTSDTTFSPDASCTRAQMAAFLWRAAGCPEPKGTSSFTDVPSDAYYAKAVAWAVENGITGGVGNDKFAPDDVCTRAQMAAFLCRLAGGKAEGAGTFTDVSADAYYAEAVQWAVENGITDGVGDNRFAPDATCTRAQIVTFLYRFFVK